jgi:hypothetical protein
VKRIWTALAIFVILVSVSAAGTSTTRKICNETSAAVTAAKAAQENGDAEKALKLSKTAVKGWHMSHRVLCMYMPHSKLESIEETISGLPMLCKYGAEDQFMADCDRSLEQLSYLMESEEPNMQNIF